MNKKDNYKSLIRHRKQIQQMEAAIEKMRAEADARIAAKQAELDAARQELRDFTATLKQLMEDTI